MSDETYQNKLREFFQSRKRMPSFSELGRLVGFKSKNAVSKMVYRLIDSGILDKDKTGRLLPGKNFYSIRILGIVEAGFPSPAEEELSDTLSLDDFLISNKDATYMLTVKGDSMKDAGIIEGDIVLVERGGEAKDGAIVVAQIDGNWTIKYLRKNKGKIYLEPANPNFKKIYPNESLKIAAVVKAVIRKY